MFIIFFKQTSVCVISVVILLWVVHAGMVVKWFIKCLENAEIQKLVQEDQAEGRHLRNNQPLIDILLVS